MGDVLRVDTGMLDDVGQSLQALRTEFSRAGDIAEDASAAVGASAVNDALHDFATNWRRHREGIVESIDAVAKMATTSARTYLNTDDKLASSLRVESSGGSQ